MTSSPFRALLVLAACAPLGATACIPYTVGTSAHTVAPGQSTRSSSYYFVPNAFKNPGDTVAAPIAGTDIEYRYGLDARSDIGFRLLPMGVTATYKRQLGAEVGRDRAAYAFLTGAGIVNAGEHAHFEATLIASGREDGRISPFGGLRAMQVVPITQGAVRDSPTIGLFGGASIGDERFTLRPELGVFYDRSALKLRSSNVIFVPAITLQRGRGR